MVLIGVCINGPQTSYSNDHDKTEVESQTPLLCCRREHARCGVQSYPFFEPLIGRPLPKQQPRHPRVYIYSHPRMPPFRYPRVHLLRHPRVHPLRHPRVHLLRHPRVHPLRHPRMLLGGDLHKRLFRLSQSYQEIPAQRPG